MDNAASVRSLEATLGAAEEQASLIKTVFEEKIGRLKKGDELPPGVFKMVKVYVAIKRKLSLDTNSQLVQYAIKWHSPSAGL